MAYCRMVACLAARTRVARPEPIGRLDVISVSDPAAAEPAASNFAKEHAMSMSRSSILATRWMAAALTGATLLASPLAVAQNAMSRHAAKAEAREETVDQRIATLHAELKITPAEESDWQAVAQTMRDNAAAMQKLASDKTSQPADRMTAIDDLQTYQAFAQAHVDNLKKLTASFQTLYSAMPDTQKKIADQVFQRAHRQDASAG